MSTFNELAAFKSLLLRKALVGAVLVGDYSAAALTDICTAGGTLAPMTGMKSMGKLTTDGISISDELEKSEVRGWGDIAGASRIDITSTSGSMTFTAMETKAAVIDAFYNVDQTNVEASATTGTVTFDKPTVPTLRDRRVLALVRDINKSNGLDVYFGVYYPRANLSANGEQALANGDSTIPYPLSVQPLVDDTLGTAQRLFWGGPGLAGLLEDMGYTVAVAP